MQWVRYHSLGLWICSQVEPIALLCPYRCLVSRQKFLSEFPKLNPRMNILVANRILNTCRPSFSEGGRKYFSGHKRAIVEDENILKLCDLKSYFAPGIPGLGIISIAGRQNILPNL